MYTHGGRKEGNICIFHVIYLGQLHSKMIKEVLVTFACLVTIWFLAPEGNWLWKQHDQMISPWILHNIFQTQINSDHVWNTICSLPFFPFSFKYLTYNTLFWFRRSPEMLPTYLVAWNYEYGEIYFIPISCSKISRG